MSPEEKLAMYERALKDIAGIKRLVAGDSSDMVYAARHIAAEALSGNYTGYQEDL